jgi:hypothetical protein
MNPPWLVVMISPLPGVGKYFHLASSRRFSSWDIMTLAQASFRAAARQRGFCASKEGKIRRLKGLS